MTFGLKKYVRIYLLNNFPNLYELCKVLNLIIGRSKKSIIHFSGWGMSTKTFPPWINSTADLETEFSLINDLMINKVENNRFIAAQFVQANVDVVGKVKDLMWRHYIVYWSASYAANRNRQERVNLVECGVCDGLTIFYALSAIGKAGAIPHAFLYDAWEGMRMENLVGEEKSWEGDYSYLQLDNTKRNLEDFKDNTTYIKGFIPDTLNRKDDPEQISWLHIDLNSSKPSIESLEYYFDRLLAGGVVLFDDYGSSSFVTTRNLVDDWFKDKKGLLLPMPTGQAIFFKL